MPSAGLSADRTWAKDTYTPRKPKKSYIRRSSHVNACDFELPLFAAPCSEVFCAPTSMVDGKMAEKADKAKRTACLGLHHKKRLPLPFPSGDFNVAGVWNKNGSPSAERRIRDDGGRCLSVGLM
ncbi:hypothetical protein TcCL_NonESM10191, partial [Trypanosoma cruzi]